MGNISSVRVRLQVLAVLVGLVGAIVVTAGAARAEDGATLRTFTADVPACSINTGIAFDGQALYLSCWGVPRLYRVSPQDGSLLDTIEVTGLAGMGALAWDATRNAMWVCDSSAQGVHLVTITGTTATADLAFTPADGCIDGLAYDGEDDTLFTSGDVRPTVYHYEPDGNLLDTRAVGDSLGGCGSSGIAIGGGDLFLGNNGCSEIYRVSNDQAAVPQYFAGFDRRIEDLECDDVTFADAGKAAIWAQDAYDAQIHAFELNVGDCGFGGLAPGGDFVYVAFGDSYQSGEGAGNSITDTTTYLGFAYENGHNFPERTGPEEDTYIDELGGNGCHRALNNYAKLNRDRLEPGADVVLVDVTCSGAQIQPAGGKPPVVGTMGEGIDADSQVQQALDQLADAGLDASDVDLVTVGMGGNDAGFGDIVAGCLLPNLLRRLIAAYPNPPGEIGFLADRFSCHFADKHFFHTEERIDALPPKEEFAQQAILDTFDSARVLQLNYPDVLPHGDAPPAWCGGMAGSDVGFAREKITAIDQAIADSIAATGDSRLELVDIEDRFGDNALCPGAGVDPLANGFAEANVEAEIDRLLDIGGDGDAVARELLDTLVDEYTEARSCLNIFNRCNPVNQWDDVTAAWDALYAHVQTELPTILSNAVQPPGPGAESQNVRFDRSRGLFHPNARGFEVMACNVRAEYLGGSAAACLADPNFQPSTVDGVPFGLAPIISGINDLLEVQLRGYAANSPVYITYHSAVVDLGQVMTDANGEATVQVTVPDAGPGVHRLRFSGVGAGGTQLVQEIKVEIPGEPVPGTSHGVYVCGFDAGTADDGVIEYVDVTTMGLTFTEIPDTNGCIFLDLPIPDDPRAHVRIDAVSQLTGQQVTHVVQAGHQLVVEQWGGPVEVPPALNRVNAGRTVPVEFRVVDADGAPVDDPAQVSVRSVPQDCSVGTDLDSGEPAEDAGMSGLRSKGDGWWQYGWQTRRSWAGTCRSFSVDLADGGRHDLWFRFE